MMDRTAGRLSAWCSAVCICLLSLGCGGELTEPQKAKVTWAGVPKSIEKTITDYVQSLPKSEVPSPEQPFNPRYFGRAVPSLPYKRNDDMLSVALGTRIASCPPSLDIHFAQLRAIHNLDPAWLTPLEDAGALTISLPGREVSLEDAVHPALRDGIRLRGQTYAVPLFLEFSCLYYRADLIETPPNTWEELIALSKKLLQERTTNSTVKSAVSFHWHALEQDVIPILWSFGGGPPICLNEDGNVFPPLDSPENLAAVKMLYELVHEHGLTASPEVMRRRTEELDDQIYREFLAGETLFLFDTTARISDMLAVVEGAAPSADNAWIPSEAIGITKIPGSLATSHPHALDHSVGSVLVSSPRSDHSREFMRQLLTVSAQQKLFDEQLLLPIYRREVLDELGYFSQSGSSHRSRLKGQLLEMAYGSVPAHEMHVRRGPSQRNVLLLIQKSLQDVLSLPRLSEREIFPLEQARLELQEAQREITEFLLRIDRLGIDCRCASSDLNEHE